MLTTLTTTLAAAAIGVTYGWAPAPPTVASQVPGDPEAAKGYEYQVRLSAEDLEALRDGRAEELSSELPASAGPIDRVRIVFDDQPGTRYTTRRPVTTEDWPDAAETFASAAPAEPESRTAYQNPGVFDPRQLSEGFQRGAQPLTDATRNAADWAAEQGRSIVEGTEDALRRGGEGLNRAAEGAVRGADDVLSGRAFQPSPYGDRPGAADSRVPTPALTDRSFDRNAPSAVPRAANETADAWGSRVDDPPRPTDRSVVPATGQEYRSDVVDPRQPAAPAYDRDGYPVDAYGRDVYADSASGPRLRAGEPAGGLSTRFTEDDGYGPTTRQPLSPVRTERRPNDWDSFARDDYVDRTRSADRFVDDRRDPYPPIDRNRTAPVASRDNFAPRESSSDWAWDNNRAAAAPSRPSYTTQGDGFAADPVSASSPPASDGWNGRPTEYATVAPDQRSAAEAEDLRRRLAETDRNGFMNQLLLVLFGGATAFSWLAYIDVRNKYRSVLRNLPGGMQHSTAA